jgi:copper resistance protein D
VNAPLIVTRWLHFAAALALTGVFSFRLLVGDPAFRKAASEGIAVDDSALTRALTQIAFAALLISLLSGTLWLLLQASVMSSQPISEVLHRGIISVVVLRTQAGHDWLVRSGLLALLAIALMLLRDRLRGRVPVVVALALAAAGLAALVWAGHAGAARGTRGAVQQTADAVHLLAAGFWLGGLVPLALLLATARRAGDERWLVVAGHAATRFSTLGVLSVASLLATGIVNSWFLVGDFAGLLNTDYGQYLLLKLGLFVVTIGVASVNHICLVPRLSSARATLGSDPAWKTIHELQRNTAIEVGLGVLILGVVGLLGTLPPAAHPHVHASSREGPCTRATYSCGSSAHSLRMPKTCGMPLKACSVRGDRRKRGWTAMTAMTIDASRAAGRL